MPDTKSCCETPPPSLRIELTENCIRTQRLERRGRIHSAKACLNCDCVMTPEPLASICWNRFVIFRAGDIAGLAPEVIRDPLALPIPEIAMFIPRSFRCAGGIARDCGSKGYQITRSEPSKRFPLGISEVIVTFLQTLFDYWSWNC